MLMGHPPQIIARGRENRPQGGFEGLTPGQVPMVVQELVACDSEVQEALADTFEAVQKIAQAGPNAFHRVAVHTCAVRVKDDSAILRRTHDMVQQGRNIVSFMPIVAHAGDNNTWEKAEASFEESDPRD